MKNLLRKIGSVAAVCIAALSLAAPASAQQAFNLKVHIPFSFVAGDRSLPAGDYRIRVDEKLGVVQLRSAETVQNVMLERYMTAKSETDPNGGFLRFAVYGNTYALRGVWSGETREGHQLTLSKTEVEMAKVIGGAGPVLSAVR